jgi:hypothetical protein
MVSRFDGMQPKLDGVRYEDHASTVLVQFEDGSVSSAFTAVPDAIGISQRRPRQGICIRIPRVDMALTNYALPAGYHDPPRPDLDWVSLDSFELPVGEGRYPFLTIELGSPGSVKSIDA